MLRSFHPTSSRSRRSLSADEIAREAASLAADAVRRQLDLDHYQPLDWDLDVGADAIALQIEGGECCRLETDELRHSWQVLEAQWRRTLGRGP
jgi:hypothetical protein